MNIKWLGHASVLITTNSGIRIITDPYRPGYFARPDGRLFYDEVKELADIVVITHEHIDHNTVDTIQGNPHIVRGAEIKGKGKVTVKGIDFKAIPTLHDESGGKVLGENSVVTFLAEGLRICHGGDLGHSLSKEQIAEIGNVDILLLCVGLLRPIGDRQFRIDKDGSRIPAPHSEYIINADVAIKVHDQLCARVTIPIHYSNDRCSFKLAGVETFLLQKKNIQRLDTSEIHLSKENLPSEQQIIVLKPAL
jgi:L-ascorbate metabolism protein UlaG (beta-lactamase superfamily)